MHGFAVIIKEDAVKFFSATYDEMNGRFVENYEILCYNECVLIIS